MSTLREVTDRGQSIWLNHMRRGFVQTGELRRLLDAGIRGITINPAVIGRAISSSADYDDLLQNLVAQGGQGSV